MTISRWVAYLQSLHPQEMELGLTRVRKVYRALFANGVEFAVITVAGTNGKGSTVELMSSILRTANLRVAKFTSPHILQFNERFEVDGLLVRDHNIIEAIEYIECCRDGVSLTFFEYTVLIALLLFRNAKVDVAIMEVGLGGRLDAVNILEPIVSVLTSVSFDHMDYLGDTLEKIAKEKIAIARTNRTCVIGEATPPPCIKQYAKNNNIPLQCINGDFSAKYDNIESQWSYISSSLQLENLPLPFDQTGVQLDNACSAIKAVESFCNAYRVKGNIDYAQGIKSAQLVGRCQRISISPDIVIDVAHNYASIKNLARHLTKHYPNRSIIGIFSMLEDKNSEECVTIMQDIISQWHVVSLNRERGISAKSLCKKTGLTAAECHNDVPSAYQAILKDMKDSDVLVIFGSFYLINDILMCI